MLFRLRFLSILWRCSQKKGVNMKTSMKFLISLGIIGTITSCAHTPNPQVYTFEIAGQTETCDWSYGTNQCFLMRSTVKEPWSITSSIKGEPSNIHSEEIRDFKYEPGFIYNVTVSSTHVSSFDGSTYELRALEIIRKLVTVARRGRLAS
jgi:hypothetical protein